MSEPRIDVWMAHLSEKMRAIGHAIEARCNRNGSTLWRIDGKRWVTPFTAARAMERAVYGREHP